MHEKVLMLESDETQTCSNLANNRLRVIIGEEYSFKCFEHGKTRVIYSVKGTGKSVAAYFQAAASLPLRAVWQRVKRHLAESGGERLPQLQLGLIHLLRSAPPAKSSDLQRKKPQFVTTGNRAEIQADALMTHYVFAMSHSKRHKKGDKKIWMTAFIFSGSWHTLYSLTCSARPCLVQPRETLSSRPCKERSNVASKRVQRGTQLIWTEVKDKRRICSQPKS